MKKEEIINGLRTLRGEFANNYKDNQRIGFIAGVNRAIEFIHSTDEPETLSQEWIDENEEQEEMYGSYGVPVHKLQNLLVPTLSETEKVQLSQKTADELNRYKELGYSLKDLLVIAASKQAQEKLARAWLDGYTVEKELLYRLKAGKNYLYFKNDGSVQTVTKKNATINKERLEKLPFDLEQALDSGIIELEELEE